MHRQGSRYGAVGTGQSHHVIQSCFNSISLDLSSWPFRGGEIRGYMFIMHKGYCTAALCRWQTKSKVTRKEEHLIGTVCSTCSG